MALYRQTATVGFGDWPPYISVAARKKVAAATAAAMAKKGKKLAPVEIQGRKIATTFWGLSWCQNLERYSDFSSRLPRGRSYVRNGSVIDLQITTGRVTALVQGSSLYTVSIDVRPVEPALWKAIVQECSGKIDSVVELLAGRLSGSVMEVITRKGTGLFPAPAAIAMRCSCPDWATMCKHLAATLYGVGARLDRQPELLFDLRSVHPAELVAHVTSGGLLGGGKARAKEHGLGSTDLSSMFGIDIESDDEPAPVKARVPAKAPPMVKPAAPVKAPPAKAPPVVKPAAPVKASAPVKPAAVAKRPPLARPAAAPLPAPAKRSPRAKTATARGVK
jgi:uncharacterized Zn finger protein